MIYLQKPQEVDSLPNRLLIIFVRLGLDKKIFLGKGYRPLYALYLLSYVYVHVTNKLNLSIVDL